LLFGYFPYYTEILTLFPYFPYCVEAGRIELPSKLPQLKSHSQV